MGAVRKLVWALVFVAAGALLWLKAGGPPELVIGLSALPLVLFGTLAVTFYFKGRSDARALRKLMEGGAWAHWTYDPFTWKQWADATFDRTRHWYRDLKPGGRIAIFILAPVCTAAGIGLGAYNGFRETGRIDWIPVGAGVLIAAAALAVVPLAIYATPRLRYRRILRSTPEVWLGPDGAFQLGRYLCWNRYGVRLRAVEIREGPPPELVFRYTINLGHGPQMEEERVLVPPGREPEARAVAARFSS